MGRNHTKYFVAGAVLAAGGLFGLAVSELAVFKAGDPIRSSEVNGNFAILKGAVEALEAPIGLSRLEIQGTGVNGKTLKFLDGALAWEDDQIGSGAGGGDISAVGAGTGLEGGGASGDVTVQIAEAFRLPQSCTGGQVPKWNGSLWACASDDVGTGGGGGGGSGDITRVTAGSGLSGGGDSGDVTLSLADNGVTTARLANGAVTTAKLADGAVTGAKLASSLTMGGLTVINSATTGFSFALRGQAGGTASLNLSTPIGLLGESAAGVGVLGGSSSGIGVEGRSASLIGVRGQGGGGAGLSISTAVGVLGEAPSGIGVIGGSQSGIGVLGRSSTRGIVGTQGSLTLPCAGNFGVGGCAESATGVYGTSSSSRGVEGNSTTGTGVYGSSTSFRGVEGVSSTGIGVLGNSNARGVVGTLGGTSCRGDLTYAMGGCASGTGFSAVFVGGSGGTGLCTFNGSAGWSCTSDRNKKENFRAVDARMILEALAKLPVTRWNMKGDANKTPHIGPTAQDFYAAFGLGEDDKTINAADAQGVALAAIKGLYQENQALKAQNAELARRMGELEAQMAGIQAMQAKLANLEARLGSR